MRRAAALLALAALGACVPVMVPVGTARLPTSTGGAAVPTATLEREMHQLVNQHRARRGLPALQYDERVAEQAREHSAAMAARARAFGHEGFDQRGAAIARVLPYHGLAENVAYDGRGGANLASLVVEGWLGSAAHRGNIEGAYDLTGIGVARDREGVVYATQIFVKR